MAFFFTNLFGNGGSSEMALMAAATLNVNTPTYKITEWPIHYIRKITPNRTLSNR